MPVAAAFTPTVSVTVWPANAGLGFRFRPICGLSFTACERTVDTDPALPASPPYTAVIEWLPCASDEVVNCAEPLARVALAITVVPSRNCTAPVADAGVTVTKNVTGPFTGDGFCVEAIEVVVALVTV